jgi:hypothetical protein
VFCSTISSTLLSILSEIIRNRIRSFGPPASFSLWFRMQLTLA